MRTPSSPQHAVTLPVADQAFMRHIIDTARKILEAGKSLDPVAFVGSHARRLVVPFTMDTSSPEANARTVEALQRTATAIAAEFVATIIPVWGANTPGLPEAKARNGVAFVMVSLETGQGVWLATVEVEKTADNRATFGEANLALAAAVNGRFFGILPMAYPMASSATLH